MRTPRSLIRPLAASAAAVLALSLAACGSTPLPDVSPGASYEGPGITEAGLTTTLGSAEKVLAEGDAAKDAEKLAPRFAGAALAARTAAYTLATKTDGARQPTPLNFTPQAVLPAAGHDFPRHAAVISQVPEGQTSPVLMTLTQANARAAYQIDHWARLFPGVTFPEIPTSAAGAEFLASDDASLAMAPKAAIEAYAKAMTDSDAAASFGEDPLRKAMTDTVNALTESLNEVGEASWQAAEVTAEPVAFRTSDGGAVVVGTVPTTLTLKKTVERSTLTVSDDLAALAGSDPVANQLTATYQVMIALYVPGKDASDKTITPLGGEQTLMSTERS